MKFNLAQPCTGCPFVVGNSINRQLNKRQLKGIVKSIRGGNTFTCYKSLGKSTEENEHCAGAMIFLERENRPNQEMEIARQCGDYVREDLDQAFPNLMLNANY